MTRESIPARPTASSGLFHELDVFRRQLSTELGCRLPPWNSSSGEVLDGIGRALDEVDGDITELKAVIEDAAKRFAAGSIEDSYFRRMFIGDGFGGRLKDFREDRKHAGKRAAWAAEEKRRAEDERRRDDEAIGHNAATIAAVLDELRPEFLRGTSVRRTTEDL